MTLEMALKEPRVRTWPLMLNHPEARVLSDSGILSAGIDERTPERVWGGGLRPTHLLYYVVSGSVSLENEAIQANAGDVLCLPAQIPKRFVAGGSGVAAVWVHVKDVEPWEVLREQGCLVHPVPHVQLMHSIMQTLLRETMMQTAQAVEATGQLSSLFLHYLLREVREEESPEDVALRKRLVDLWNIVSSTLEQNWTVAALSAEVNMSEGHFHREVYRLFGQNPIQIVRRLRMERAAALLKSTSFDLTSIAEEVGYNTPYSFSNAFYKHMGIRPMRYRRAGNEKTEPVK